MPTFEVTGPDGKTYELDAVDERAAAAAFQKFVGSNAPKPPAGPQWSTQSAGNYVTGLMSNLNQSLPFVGTYDDELRAVVKALPALFDDRSFPEEYRRQKGENVAQAETFRRERPIEATGARVAGGLMGGGLMATTKAGQQLLGMTAGNLPRQVGTGLASGSVMGYAAGHGEGEGGILSPDRMRKANTAAKWGAGFGGAIPVVAAGGGSLVRAIAERNALPQSMGPAAGRFMIEAAEADTGAAQRLAQLGDEATLADSGPSFLGLAQGIAVAPGPGKSAIVDALTGRHRANNQRLARDTNQSIGLAQTPSAVEESLEVQRSNLTGPLYKASYRSTRKMDATPALQEISKLRSSAKGGVVDALDRVENLLHRETWQQGRLVRVPENRVEGMHNARKALDDMIGSLRAQEGSGAKGAERALNIVRGKIDAVLKKNAKFRQADAIYADYTRRIEALQEGQRALRTAGDNVQRPDELTDTLAALTPEGRDAFKIGTRADIDRMTGTSANDLVALRKAVLGEGDWNRDKLRQIFGRDEADAMIAAVDREGEFANTFNKVVENSQTAQRTGAAKKLGPRDQQRVDMGTSGAGLALRVAQETGLWGLRQLGARSRAGRNEELARLLMLSGPQRDALLRELRNSIFARGQSGQAADQVSAIVRQLLMSQIPQASTD